MGQSGWRLPDELLRRVRVRAAETGVAQNVLVERALEKALGPEAQDTPVSGVGRPVAPSRTPVPGVRPAREILREGVDMDRQARVNALRDRKAKKP